MKQYIYYSRVYYEIVFKREDDDFVVYRTSVGDLTINKHYCNSPVFNTQLECLIHIGVDVYNNRRVKFAYIAPRRLPIDMDKIMQMAITHKPEEFI
jgi:hypothetical protein